MADLRRQLAQEKSTRKACEKWLRSELRSRVSGSHAMSCHACMPMQALVHVTLRWCAFVTLGARRTMP